MYDPRKDKKWKGCFPDPPILTPVPDGEVWVRAQELLTEHFACAPVCLRRDCRREGRCLSVSISPCLQCYSPVWTQEMQTLTDRLFAFYRETRALEPPPDWGEDAHKAGRKFDEMVGRHLKAHQEKQAAKRRRNNGRPSRRSSPPGSASTVSDPGPGNWT